MSKFFGKFRNYDDDENYNFHSKKKKRDQQKITRKKSNYNDDYDYYGGYDDYQKPARRKARHFD